MLDDPESLQIIASRYHELFALAEDVIYVLDAAGNVLDLNAAGERVTGYRREELVGRPIAQLVLPEHLPQMLQMLEQKIEGQPVTTYEVEIQSRDGRRVALEVSTRLVYRDGQPVEIHGIARDITRRRQAREQRGFLTDVSQVLTTTLDDDAILAHIASLAVPRVADYCIVDVVEPDGSLHRAALRHADPAYAPILAELAERYPPRQLPLTGVPLVLREGKTLFSPAIGPGELEAAAQDDRHLELLRRLDPRSAVMVPLWIEGQVSGVITLARSAHQQPYTPADVAMAEELARWAAQALVNARAYQATRRARLEAEQAVERIARLQHLTAALAEALTPNAIADVVVKHGIAAAGAYAGSLVARHESEPLLELLAVEGYGPGGWDSRTPIDMAAPLPIAEAARSGEPIWLPTREAYLTRYPQVAVQAGAQTQTLALAALPLNLGEETLGALGLSFAKPQNFDQDAQDFLLALAQQCAQALARARLYADEQRARAEAEAAVQLRDTFLSVASHELKTPLTALIGQAQLLQRRVARESGLPERDRRSVDQIVAQAGRLNRLIIALLDTTRIQQGRLEIERAACDLTALTRRVLEAIGPTLPRHQILDPAPAEPLLIMGDELRLEQVVLNLLENAAKYSPLGGSIGVELAREGAEVRLSVCDSGIGMPAEALPRLFTRFYRASNAQDAHISGMGIGLYVVREIVSLHGGRVAVSSEEGLGSTFSVWLPLADTATR